MTTTRTATTVVLAAGLRLASAAGAYAADPAPASVNDTATSSDTSTCLTVDALSNDAGMQGYESSTVTAGAVSSTIAYSHELGRYVIEVCKAPESLAPGDVVTVDYVATSAAPSGATAPATITVTVAGAGDAPAVTAPAHLSTVLTAFSTTANRGPCRGDGRRPRRGCARECDEGPFDL